MVRLWIGVLTLSELGVSSFVHMVYGFYIFSTAVASDLAQAIYVALRLHNSGVTDVVVKDDGEKKAGRVDGLPPIVLVHGIFGFGQGVRVKFATSLIRFFFISGFDDWTGVAEIGRIVLLCWCREEG